MEKNQEQWNALIAKLQLLDKKDIQHLELGEGRSLGEVNDAVQESIKKLTKLLELAEPKIICEIPVSIRDKGMKAISDSIIKVESFADQADQITNNFLNDNERVKNQAERDRGNLIPTANKYSHEIEINPHINTLEMACRTRVLEQLIASKDVKQLVKSLGDGASNIDQALEKATGLRGRTANLLRDARAAKTECVAATEELRKAATKLIDTNAKSTFSKLANWHNGLSIAWFIFAVFASIFAGCMIKIVIDMPVTGGETNAELLHLVIKRLLLVSAPIVLLRLALIKFNAERHLRIIYSHRNAVLQQLDLLESAIPNSEVTARAALRLEVTKMILSDPNTAYAKLPTGGEVNFNSLISDAGKTASESVRPG